MLATAKGECFGMCLPSPHSAMRRSHSCTEPETCSSCDGVGYVLIPLESEESFDHCDPADDSLDSELPATRPNTPIPCTPTFDINLDLTAEMAAMLGSVIEVPNDAAVSVPETTVAGACSTDPVDVDHPSVSVDPYGQLALDPGPIAAPAGQGPPLAPPLTSAPLPSAPGPVLPTLVAAIPSAPPAPPVAAIIAPPNHITLPPTSTVIPGMNPLGPNHPVPIPYDALFAEAGRTYPTCFFSCLSVDLRHPR